jgi:hypothetical protein
MRESFADWEKWFAKKAGVALPDCCIDRDAAFEAIQRRHLFVHTGGHVSRQYLERLGRNEPPTGTQLRVDDQYLEQALDELDVLGVALGTNLAVTWDPDE